MAEGYPTPYWNDPSNPTSPVPFQTGDDFDTQVQSLYQSMLGRQASADEINSLRGHNLEEIRQGITTSGEYRTYNYPTTNGVPSKSPPPPTDTSGGNGGGGGGGGGTPGPQPDPNGTLFQPFPDPAPKKPGPYTPPPVPTLNMPTFDKPGPWSYDNFQAPGAFVAPTGADAQADPGYAFRQEEGLGAIRNERASQGLLASGGTLKDFAAWNQNYASNEYGNVYNRRAQEYDRNFNDLYNTWASNRQNSLDQYTTNFGMSKDVYDRNAQAAAANYAPQLHQWDTDVAVGQKNQEDDWQRQMDLWNQNYKIWDDQRRWKYGVLDNERNKGLGTLN